MGAAMAFFVELPHRLISAIMGFGGGVLIAVLSVDLMEKAFTDGGALPTLGGFLSGAIVFCFINWRLAKRGAKHRKRCGGCVQQPTEAKTEGSGVAIAVGALLDGVPESIVIGLPLLGGDKIGLGLVAGLPRQRAASALQRFGYGSPRPWCPRHLRTRSPSLA